MNSDFNKNYLVNELAQIASNEIQSFQDLDEWGYLPIYATSAILNIDRSYPEYFQKIGLSDNKNIMLQKIIANKFDEKKFIEDNAKKAVVILDDQVRNI
jgi:4-hydroxy 2-oxovalerate aldolase